MSDAPAAGHNSDPAEKLRSLVERIERLNEERKELSSDIRDIYVEAKSAGYDTKVLRQVIADRAKDIEELREQEAMRETYRNALGMGL